MVGRKNFSQEDKRVAIELYRAKVPLNQIRAQTQMSEATLRHVLAYSRKNPSLPIKKRRTGSGRKSLVGQETVRLVKKFLIREPTLTAKNLKERIPGLQHLGIRAIQKICLKKCNLPSRKMAAKPLLTEKMKQKRVAFAHQYGHWTVEDWKKVMFSDESHFELQFARNFRCRRAVGSDRLDPRYTRKTVKHPLKIMAWGSFSWRGRGGLEFLAKGEMMNGPRYLMILENKLEFFLRQHCCSHFLQDGAPCHRSKVVTKWFADHPEIQLIDWPGNSPDLNPIENVWAWMKQQLQNCKATSLPELQRKITELWTLRMDNIDYLKSLIESMPRRLQAVIEKEGNSTKY